MTTDYDSKPPKEVSCNGEKSGIYKGNKDPPWEPGVQGKEGVAWEN